MTKSLEFNRNWSNDMKIASNMSQCLLTSSLTSRVNIYKLLSKLSITNTHTKAVSIVEVGEQTTLRKVTPTSDFSRNLFT